MYACHKVQYLTALLTKMQGSCKLDLVEYQINSRNYVNSTNVLLINNDLSLHPFHVWVRLKFQK